MNVNRRVQERPHHLSLILSIIAIALSGFGFWESHKSREISYRSALPQFETDVRLSEPISAGKDPRFVILIKNFGRSEAKEFTSYIGTLSSPQSQPFQAEYPNNLPVENVSDFAQGSQIFIVPKTGTYALGDDEVNAILSGRFILYIFGRSTYKDFLGQNHETHFCRLYNPNTGQGIPQILYCNGYNDTN